MLRSAKRLTARLRRAMMSDPCGVESCIRPRRDVSAWCDIHSDALLYCTRWPYAGPAERLQELDLLATAYRLYLEVMDQEARDDNA